MNERAAALRSQLIRSFASAELTAEVRAPLYDTRCARLAEGTAARRLGASFDVVAPGKRACPYHFHHHEEELFVILRGSGTLRVAGELLPVAAGELIFIPAGPAYPHQLINSSGAPLEYLSISTREAVEVIEYPDSGKVMASAPGLRHITRGRDAVDYWEGEP
jgi:uncharacterized cupin superfamily protein